MSLQQFAERTRTRIRRDGCADLIIPGKFGHLYEHDSGVFGATLEDSVCVPSRSRSLLARRRKALAAGFRLHQAGDAEAILLFDPSDHAQTKLAIRLVGIKRIRRPSVPTLAQLRQRALFSSRARPRRAFTGQETAQTAGVGV